MKNAACLPLLSVAAALVLAAGPAAAGRPHVSVGVQIGPVAAGYHQGGRFYGHHPQRGYWHGGIGFTVLAPLLLAPPVYDGQPHVMAAPQPAAAPGPDPVIYPRNGQDAQQTEFDRQDCNRWATTQPAALADAGVFHRAVVACMDGRGYTLK